MKGMDWLGSIEGIKSENKFHRVMIPVLALGWLVTLVALLSRDQIVVVQPPTAVEKVWVGQKASDEAYKKAWGLYVAELVGNVTPSSADFIANSLQDMLDPKVFDQVSTAVLAAKAQFAKDHLITSFVPKDVQFDKKLNRVFVVGKGSMRTVGQIRDVQEQQRVFEMSVTIRNYRPMLTYYSTYFGEPRNSDNIDRIERLEADAKNKAEAAAKEDK